MQTLGEDRALYLQAVLDGQLGVEYVSLEEIVFLQDVIFEEEAAKLTPFATWETIQ